MSPVEGPRPALVKRLCQSDAGPQTATFHACWQHAYKLETDTFDVPNFIPLDGSDITEVKSHERDDAGCWCSLCSE